MRPILAAYNTTVYKLSKFLVPLIEQFTVNEFSLKNSYEFYNSIVHQRCQDNAFLISFDISSSYTNVPVNESINILCNKAFFQLAQLSVVSMSHSFVKC